MRTKCSVLAWSVALVLAVVAARPASAAMITTTYGMSRITNNSPTDVAGQLFVDVIDEMTDGLQAETVSFVFRNEAGVDCSITDIYFDDGDFAWGGIECSAGVKFSQLARPDELPGGGIIGFETSSSLSADADSPGPVNGVDDGVGEWLKITFYYTTGISDYDTVLTRLATGELRVGLRATSIDPGDYSDSFVNTFLPPPPGGVDPVPEPATFIIWSVLGGLGIMISWLRRRNQ